MMQHIHNLLHTQGAAIQKISSAQNIKGDSLLYPKSASVEDFTYVDYKKRFSQSISEIPTICTHRVGFGKSWRKRRLMKRDPNKLGTRNRSAAYLDYMTRYICDFVTIHADIKPHPNMHMAMHIPHFLRLFGPVRSWWCFPF